MYGYDMITRIYGREKNEQDDDQADKWPKTKPITTTKARKEHINHWLMQLEGVLGAVQSFHEHNRNEKNYPKQKKAKQRNAEVKQKQGRW